MTGAPPVAGITRRGELLSTAGLLPNGAVLQPVKTGNRQTPISNGAIFMQCNAAEQYVWPEVLLETTNLGLNFFMQKS